MSSQLKVMLNCEDGNTKRDTKKRCPKTLITLLGLDENVRILSFSN